MQRNLHTLLLPFILLLVLSGISNDSFATHAAGADLSYEHLGNNTYRFQWTFYRACETGSAGAPSAVNMQIYSPSCNINTTISISQDANSRTDITPLCSSAQSKCNGGTYAGYEKYTYTRTYALPQQCSDYEFYVCYYARNNGIQTIVSPGSKALCVSAGLNNVIVQNNNSSKFTNDPIGFICTNQNFCFNHGAIDADGDLLTYELVDPLALSSGNSGTIVPVTYQNGFSKNNPLTGTTTFNNANGDLCFNATSQQISIVAVKVKEYRNGQLIGYTTRDIQLYTLNCSNNIPQLSGLDGVIGSSVSSMTVCAGQNVNFNINSTDGNGDNLTMTWNTGVPNASFTTSGSPFPTGNFNWTPTQADAGAGGHCFTVTVKDNHCPYFGTSTRSYCIYVQSPNPQINNAGPFCENDGVQNLIAQPTGGSWSGNGISNANSGTFNPAIAGPGLHAITYNYVDANGCSGSDQKSIRVHAAPTANAGQNKSSCGASNVTIGGSPTATGGSPGYTYNWSPSTGLNNAQIANPLLSNISNTTYNLTVTDKNGCKDNSSVTVGLSNLVVTNQKQDVLCHGDNTGSVSLSTSGGNGAYTYNWGGGQTGNSLSGLSAGTYSFTVTDGSGCTKSQTITISQPNPISIASNLQDVDCAGGNNGSIILTSSGGVGGYSYNWSNGNVSNLNSNLSAGSYTVTVTDANNCSQTGSYTISQSSSLATTSSVTDVTCNGLGNGSIIVSASGGTPGYSFNWSNGQITQNLTSATAGTYTLTITDSKNCQKITTHTITEPTTLSGTLSANPVGCSGNANGSINMNAFGGVSPYSFVWSPNANGQTSSNVSNLSNGMYIVTVTDANNCQFTDSINVGQPSALTLTETSSPVLCNGGSDGSATISAAGGVGNYSYNWPVFSSNAGATNSNLSAGIYVVTVLDGNNCASQITVTINEPPILASNETVTNETCYQFDDGSIHLITSGGIAPYTYKWSNGESTSSINTLSPGHYSVTVMDANGCTEVKTSSIADAPSLFVDVIGPREICEGDNAQLIVQHTGGTYFEWNVPGQTDTINLTPTQSAMYVAYVSNANNCAESDSVYVMVNPLPEANISGDSMLCENGSLRLVANSATGVSYDWNTGEQGSSIQISGMNIINPYSLTVTDAKGCQNVSQNQFNISLLPNPEAEIEYAVYGAYQNQIQFNFTGYGDITAYSWDFGDGEYSALENPVHDFDNTGYFETKLIVVNDYGCADTAEVVFNIQENIEIPNVFTPNEDGYNDQFIIPSNGMQEFLLVIYNRWGTELFRAESTRLAWDGTTHAGREAPEGTYYFELIATGSIDHSTSGHVTLIRE
jgi:gliding motility-associated-like protein